MKKILFISTVFLFIGSFCFSQSPLSPGERQFNAGLGVGGDGIPVYGGVDFAVADNITLGPEVQYRTIGDGDFDLNTFSVLGVFNYHFDELFTLPSDWNIYAGAHAGFYFIDTPANYNGREESGFGLGLQVGARYFVSERFGLNLQVGGGSVVSDGRLGISLKF